MLERTFETEYERRGDGEIRMILRGWDDEAKVSVEPYGGLAPGYTAVTLYPEGSSDPDLQPTVFCFSPGELNTLIVSLLHASAGMLVAAHEVPDDEEKEEGEDEFDAKAWVQSLLGADPELFDQDKIESSTGWLPENQTVLRSWTIKGDDGSEVSYSETTVE